MYDWFKNLFKEKEHPPDVKRETIGPFKYALKCDNCGKYEHDLDADRLCSFCGHEGKTKVIGRLKTTFYEARSTYITLPYGFKYEFIELKESP